MNLRQYTESFLRLSDFQYLLRVAYEFLKGSITFSMFPLELSETKVFEAMPMFRLYSSYLLSNYYGKEVKIE